MICGKDLINSFLDEENESKESIKISLTENGAPPFDRETQVGRDSIDLRIGSTGYKIMCDYDFINTLDTDIDKYFYDIKLTQDGITIEPGETVVVNTVERIKLNGNITGELVGRTRYARMGLSVSAATKFQSYSNSIIVLQICNHNKVPLKIFPYQKLVQLVIHQIDGIPNVMRGKYCDEEILTKPIIDDEELIGFSKNRKKAINRQKPKNVPYMTKEGKFDGKNRIKKNNMLITLISRVLATITALLGIVISVLCSFDQINVTIVTIMAFSTAILSAVSILLDIIKVNNFIDEE